MQIAVLFDERGAHVPVDGDPSACAERATPDQLAAGLRAAQERLRTVPIAGILGLLDAAGQAWVQPSHPAARTIASLSMGFLPLWLRSHNLEAVCDLALRGNREALDRFVPALPGAKLLHRAQPRGILVHWLAGNVPLLGMISLVQGLLGKNANLVKVARQKPGILPFFLDALSRVAYTGPDGGVLEGRVLTDAVRVVYTPREDTAAARALSALADLRVAWGGREAVEAIMNLPRRFGAEDLVFGPKTSFAIVGAEMLAGESVARRAARLLAMDTVALEQRGCNSPHTVFVERGGGISPSGFAALLSEELRAACQRLAAPALTVPEAFEVASLRAEYDMRGEAFYDRAVAWSVLFSEDDCGLPPLCYGRTLFVRPVDDVFEVAPLCSVNTQTAGLAVLERRLRLADALTARGVERCPELGRMSVYESPWDGVYPLDRMVRWVSTCAPPGASPSA
jgi:hypothetical protein